MSFRIFRLILAAAGILALSGCETNPAKPAADPNNPSPTSGSTTSQQANEMADRLDTIPFELDAA